MVRVIDALFEAQDNIDSYVMLDLKTHNISNIKKYFKIIFPLMLPYLEMSIIMSFGLGFKVIVMGEYMMQSPSTLGLLIYYKKANIEIEYLLDCRWHQDHTPGLLRHPRREDRHRPRRILRYQRRQDQRQALEEGIVYPQG